MKNETNKIEERVGLLKNARLELLRLHKTLIDAEREKYEEKNGQISSGQFLNLLLNEESFQWLRKFSALIVDIDEMFDLDDGFDEQMVEKHLSAMSDILMRKTTDENFNEKYQSYLESQPEVEKKNEEIVNLISE